MSKHIAQPGLITCTEQPWSPCCDVPEEVEAKETLWPLGWDRLLFAPGQLCPKL